MWHQSQRLRLVLDDLYLFLVFWTELSATVKETLRTCDDGEEEFHSAHVHTVRNLYLCETQSHTKPNQTQKGVAAKGQTSHNTPGCVTKHRRT